MSVEFGQAIIHDHAGRLFRTFTDSDASVFGSLLLGKELSPEGGPVLEMVVSGQAVDEGVATRRIDFSHRAEAVAFLTNPQDVADRVIEIFRPPETTSS